MTNNQQVIANIFNLCEKLGLMVHSDVFHEGVYFVLGDIDEDGTVLTLVGSGTPKQLAVCEKSNIQFFNIHHFEDMLLELYRDTKNIE